MPPGDLYADSDARLVAMTADLDPEPLGFASRALFDRLDKLAPDTLEIVPVVLVGPEGEERDYVAVTPKAMLAARSADDAKPGDLQWATTAFAPRDAPAQVFELRDEDQRFLLVARAVAEALDVDSLADVQLSAFHQTPETGGARPAIAALSRMMEGEEEAGDSEIVSDALRDGMAAPKSKPKADTKPANKKTKKPRVAKKTKASKPSRTKAKKSKASRTKAKSKAKKKTRSGKPKRK